MIMGHFLDFQFPTVKSTLLSLTILYFSHKHLKCLVAWLNFSFHSKGIWQLCSHSYDWWRTLHFGFIWHSGSRGLRQAAASIISTNWCLPSLLFSGVTVFVWERQRKMGTWNYPSLPENAFFTGKYHKCFLAEPFLPPGAASFLSAMYLQSHF